MKKDDYFYINKNLYNNKYTGKKIHLKKNNKDEYYYKGYIIKKKFWRSESGEHMGIKWVIYINNKEIISCFDLNTVEEYFASIRKN